MKTRPTTKPQGPTEPTGDGWMSYGGHRAHNRAMEDWDDDIRHWHHDALERGIRCYPDCGYCQDTLKMTDEDWQRHTQHTEERNAAYEAKGWTMRCKLRDAEAEVTHAAWSLAQTEAGRAWMTTEEAHQAALPTG